MIRLFLSKDDEMGAIYSFLIYLFFIITHSVIILLRKLLKNNERWLMLITTASIFPSIITGILILILSYSTISLLIEQ
jgi:hypothetical protein